MTRVLAVKIYEYLLRTGEEVVYVNRLAKAITREDCTAVIFGNSTAPIVV
jgi:hypothetical protein